ncbi:MAG: hypothetical protein JJ992_14380, partial [Planctomycetes bacterium]|nr:hypothetical protein [Planctomycetota bacterium]
IYYIPVVTGDFDYGAVVGLSQPRDHRGARSNGAELPLSFLVSYDLAGGKIADLGLLQADDGRLAYGMGGADCDREGRIWFVGAFEEPNPEYVVGKLSDKFPYSLGLGCFDPQP